VTRHDRQPLVAVGAGYATHAQRLDPRPGGRW